MIPELIDTATPVHSSGMGLMIGRQPVVQDLDLSLCKGEIVGLLGVNGAGKSSTLRVLAGLLTPSSGSVRVFGAAPASDPRVRARIGYLPDMPPLLRELSVLENIDTQARLFGLAGSTRSAAVARMIEVLELGELRRRLAGHLSRGQAQRAALAMTLVHAPDLLLLDEPTTGLDPLQISQLRELLRELGAAGSSILFSSHQLPEVASLCERVLVMHQGRLHHEHHYAQHGSGLSRQVELDRDVEQGFWEGVGFEVTRITARCWQCQLSDSAQLESLLRHLLAQGVLPLSIQQAPAMLEQVFLGIASGKQAQAA